MKGCITMAKVYEFPKQKQLTKDMENLLYQSAKGYLLVMMGALTELCGEVPNHDEMEEVKDLVAVAYTYALIKAVEDLGDEL